MMHYVDEPDGYGEKGTHKTSCGKLGIEVDNQHTRHLHAVDCSDCLHAVLDNLKNRCGLNSDGKVIGMFSQD